MSIGPSTLGNLLVQRLDSALGISQTTQHRTGAHPDALRHTQSLQRLTQGDNPTSRSTRESVDRAKQGESSRVQGRSDARLENQLQKYTDNRFTPSAPTTLGKTARTILALLTQYSQQPVQGQRPLVDPRQPNTPAGTAAQNATAAKPQAASAAAGRGAATTSATAATWNPANLSTHAPLNSTAASTANAALGAGTAAAATAAAAPTPSALQLVTQAFAQALQHNVQQSGLFYESKLAQLVKGQITADSLQQQPQAHTPQRAQIPPTVISSAASQHADAPTLSLQQSGIDPSTQQLVRQQLEVLANQVFNWRGEAWPGVPLELEIERQHDDESDANHSDDEDADTPWQTRLTLQLPQLGNIQARLHVHDNTVRLHIQAPDSADRLKNNLTSLVDRLEAQGIGIQQLQIVREDDTYLEPSPYYDEDPFYD